MRSGRWLAAVACTLIVALLTASGASGARSRPGHYVHGTYGAYTYLLYVPRGYRPKQHVPLVVLLHGCSTTAAEQAQASNYGPLADRHDFLVLYPDNGAVDTNPARCWKALYTPQLEGRGMGDGAAIAGMTQKIIAAWHVDSTRVYAIGLSSGAFETSVLGAAYPDLFAAIGINSGGAYMRGSTGCIGPYQAGPSPATLAAEAYAEEGPRARIVPVIFFHGDADGTVPYECGLEALAQWLQTDNDVLMAAGAPAIPATPASSTNGQVPGGHAYTVNDYREPGGCLIAQFWTVHGMGHFWSGGSPNPAVATWTDPLGPSAAAASWAFFTAHRLTPAGAASPCV